LETYGADCACYFGGITQASEGNTNEIPTQKNRWPRVRRAPNRPPTLIDNAATARESLVPLGVAYDEICERIKVRLGRRHDVTRAYVAAGVASLDVSRAVDRVVTLHLPRLDGEQRVGVGALDSIEQERATIDTARQHFNA